MEVRSFKKEGLNKLFRNPSKSVKMLFFIATLFIAIWSASIAGQAPDNSTAGNVALWLGFGTVPLMLLPFANEAKRKIRTQVVLCTIFSFVMLLSFVVGYESVNSGGAGLGWFDAVMFFFIGAVMVFPMLLFSAVWVGIIKLLEHYRLVPSFLRT